MGLNSTHVAVNTPTFSPQSAPLLEGQTPTRERILLEGLAAILPPDELERLLEDLPVSARNRQAALRAAALRHGTPATRTAAERMLHEGSNLEQQDAVNYLVNTRNAQPLAASWQRGDALVRATVRRAGFEIHPGEAGATLEPRADRPPDGRRWMFLAVLACILLAGWLLQRRRKSV